MKKTYREPELEITLFPCDDVIQCSISGDDEWGFKPIEDEEDM